MNTFAEKTLMITGGTGSFGNAVTDIFLTSSKNRVIGIHSREKMYEILLTNEECAQAIALGKFYRVPCDKSRLNYDKYFIQEDAQRNVLSKFNSNNIEHLNVKQVKDILLASRYIQDKLKA